MFLAFLTEAAVGFGATILTVTLASHLIPLKVLLPAFVPLNMLLSLWVVVSHHEQIDRARLTRRILPAVAVGMLLGMGAYRLGSPEGLLLAFGAFVLVLSSVELVRALRTERPPERMPAWRSMLMLGAGGLIHGMFGSGGPLIVYVAGRQLHDKGRFRATLAALWLILNAVLLVSYLLSDELNTQTLTTSAMMLPMLGLGIVVGERAHKLLPQRAFRVTVWLVLLIAALIRVARSAMS